MIPQQNRRRMMPCFRGTCPARRWSRPSLRVVLYLLSAWFVIGLLLQLQLFRTAHTTNNRTTNVGLWTSHNEEEPSMTTMMATVVTKMTKLEQTQHTLYKNMMHKLDTTTAQLVALQQQQQQPKYDVEHLTPLLIEEHHDQFTKTKEHVIERLQIPSDVLRKNRKVDDNTQQTSRTGATTTHRIHPTPTTPTALFTSQDIKSVIKDLIQSWTDLMQNVNDGLQDDANSNNNNITINTNTNTTTNTNTIDYFIAMGTLLGQYCNEGFLPNDSDGDVVMIAAHFDRMVRILQETPQLQQQQQHTNRSAAAIESNATTTTTTATPASVNNRILMIPAHTQLIVRSGLHSKIIAAKYAHIGTGYYIDIAVLHPHIDDDHPVVITETGNTSASTAASASASRYYEHQAGNFCTNCHTKYVHKKRIVGEQGGALPKFLVLEEQDIYPLNTACRFENMTVSCPHKPLALLQQLYKTPFYNCPRTQKRRTTT